MKRIKLYSKSLIVALIMLLLSSNLFSQKAPVYYMQNMIRTGINPAYSGMDGIYNMVVLTRQQWVGFDGAPKSYFISASVPFSGRRAGIGFDAEIVSAGPSVQKGIFINYSYNLNITGNSSLSFGLRAGANIYSIDLNSLLVVDPGDHLFETSIENRILPNFGAGLHYSIGNYYIDLSIPTFLRNELSASSDDNVGEQNKENRVYATEIGSMYILSEKIKIQPSIAALFTERAPPLVDFKVTVELQDAVGFGFIYRSSGLFGGHLSYKVSDNFILCYAYELPLAYNYQINSGTHEVVLGINFEFLKKKTLSPRRF